jgi:hypothetical protein
MPRRHVLYEVREEFFELVCSGMALQAAGALLGVREVARNREIRNTLQCNDLPRTQHFATNRPSSSSPVEEGYSSIIGADALGIRAVASTDLMEQIRILVADKAVNPAAPIVLAGAALEIALRGAVEEIGLEVSGSGSISAYGKALRGRELDQQAGHEGHRGDVWAAQRRRSR